MYDFPFLCVYINVQMLDSETVEESALCLWHCTRCVLSDSSLSQCVSEDTGKTYGPKGPRVTVLAFWSPVKDVASLRH